MFGLQEVQFTGEVVTFMHSLYLAEYVVICLAQCLGYLRAFHCDLVFWSKQRAKNRVSYPSW
jgi:hypothetical protein